MQLHVNGELQDVLPHISLRALLQHLGLKEDRVAVELNREIVRRERWNETTLQEQDRLEIVQFVGGG